MNTTDTLANREDNLALLPQKYDDNDKVNYYRLPGRGSWVSRNTSFLGDMASYMTRGTAHWHLSDVTALPDIWGQAVCFHAAFHSLKHVLHDTVIQEWRGLLAIIGLRFMRNLPLRFEPLDLTVLAASPYTHYGQRNPSKKANFGTAVLNSFPNFIDPEDQDRGKIDLIMYAAPDTPPKPLGFTFDHTLVIPGRDYRDVFNQADIPWGSWADAHKGHPLRNPCAKLNEWERDAMVQWLDQLIEAAKKESDPPRDGRLIDELILFRNDLLNKDTTKQRSFTWIDTAQEGDPAEGVRAKLFTVPCDLSTTPRLEANHWELPQRPGSTPNIQPKTLTLNLRQALKSTPLQGAFVFDPVWRNIWPDLPIPIVNKTLRDLPPDEAKRKIEIQQWKAFAAKEGWLMLTPDDLFTDNLARLKKSIGEQPQLPDGLHPPGMERYLLPLKPLVSALLETEELRRGVRLFYDLGRGRPVAVLSLELDNRETLVMEKYYDSRPDRVINITPPDFLSQWPAFVSPEWRHYYLDATGSQDTLKMERAIAPGRLPDLLANAEKDSVVGQLRQWSENDSAHLLVDAQMGKSQWHTCLLADRPIEAVTFAQYDGLCLVQRYSEEVPVNNESFQIAVDFGSSATRILLQHAGPIPSGPLDAPLFTVFGSIVTISLQSGFDCQPGETALLLSLLATRPEKYANPPNTEISRGAQFIPLPPTYTEMRADMLKILTTGQFEPGAAAARYEFGFKYANRRRKNTDIVDPPIETIRKMLAESCLFAAAGAVGRGAKINNIAWAFAYPATYLTHTQRKFIDSCRYAIARINGSPLTGRGNGTPPPARYVVEPLAAYYYYRKLPIANVNGIVAVIDIGGHSSDICISCRENPVWAGSLALAGQHVLTDYFIYNDYGLDGLENSSNTTNLYQSLKDKLRREIDGGSIEALLGTRAYVETVLAQNQSNLATQCGNSNAKEEIDNLARLFLCGITAYLSMILSYCQRTGRFGAEKDLHLFICGRGSLLFNNFLEKEYIGTVCNRFLTGSITSVSTIHTHFVESQNAKQEAAGGLLYVLRQSAWDEEAAQRLVDDSPMPLGEDIALAGNPAYTPGDYIPSSKFENPAQLDLVSLDNFQRFLDEAGRQGVKNLKTKPQEIAALMQKAKSLFQAECRNAAEACKTRRDAEGAKATSAPPVIQAQPPFILALRACIEMLIKS